MNNKVFTKVQKISKWEAFILFFIKMKTRNDIEVTPRGYYIYKYKMWRGKMFVMNMEFKRYEK